MKYIAVLDTDEIEDFDFFEDGIGKYLHAVDANAENGEWIYLPFRPLEQQPTLDKIIAEIESIEHYGTNNGADFWLRTPEEIKKDVLNILDKYRAEVELERNEG